MEKHFCICPVSECPNHPVNHDEGCDLCIKKNLRLGEIPSCFFAKVSGDFSEVNDYTIKGFVDFYLTHNK